MNNRSAFWLCPALLALSVAGEARAAEIYRWVDDDGVVHYSDTRPEAEEGITALQTTDRNPTGYEPSEDPYSILNQAQRTNDTWTEIEKARRERLEKRREEAASRPPPLRYYDPYSHVYAYRYYPPYYPPSRPPQPPPRPGKTVVRQLRALDELGLTGPRPHSINSGRHHQRVKNSGDFLSKVVRPTPRPMPGDFERH